MKPAPFTYHRPGSVDEALDLLGELGPEAKPLGGGQSLGPMLNMRLARPAHLVDLNDLIELDFVRDLGDRVEVGALTRHHRIATAPELRRANPLLAEAAATIGHYAIRQRGTMAGSLVHADPAAQLPLVAAALGAQIVIRSRQGERKVAAADFLRSIMTVDLRDGELVTAVRFPKLPEGAGWAFELFSRRRGDFAVVAVAVTICLTANGAVRMLRLGLGGVAATPLRMDRLAQDAVGARPDSHWCASLAQAVSEAIEPEDDRLVPAAFRRDLARTLTERALVKALERIARR